MDINGIASVAAQVSAQRTGDAVGVSVLRKALDIQAQSAVQLLQALPQPAKPRGTTETLGTLINTYA